MKYSYKWLKQFVDFDKNPQELADDLSCKSIEIENIERFGSDFFENVVVGEIKEIDPHPDADKLRVTKTDVGNEILQIVCGASNIEVGQKVPVALIGAKLPMGEIKETKIRGVDSHGMLCAEDEIGFGSSHEGIMILDEDLKIGTKLSEIYSDWVLDGDVLSNRGDLQNHAGLALEIAAIYGKNIKEEIEQIEDKTNEISNFIEVKNEVPETYYSLRIIKGIKVGPSPAWMQQSLLACGLKPINNVVDITNYVMLKYGNPLHAFDAKKIPEVSGKHQLTVRLTGEGESIRTLDGKDHKLNEGILVIADSKELIAVAGVMGGENTEISADTRDIILESAVFNQKLIRNSQRELGIRTEASSRFEKGLSTYLAKVCLDEAAKLFVDVCGGEIIPGKVVKTNIVEKNIKIICNINRIKSYLSINISTMKMAEILDGLGIENEVSGEIIFCTVPQWRRDISIWQDIAEEIGRIYGLDAVIERKLATTIKPKTKKMLYFEQSAKRFFSNSGLNEVFSLSIVSNLLLEKTSFEKRYFEITNPLNENDFIMRSSLIPGLLYCAAENAKKQDRFGLFDISKVYLPSQDEEIPSFEQRNLAILIYGEKDSDGLYIAKEYIESFGRAFDLEFSFENLKEGVNKPRPCYHPGRYADIVFQNEKIGEIFEVHPAVLKKMDIKKRTWVLEVYFERLCERAENIEMKFRENNSEVIFQEFSKFEISKRDLAIVLDKNYKPFEIEEKIKDIDPQIVSVELFDEYVSDKFGEGKKSLAFHITFQSSDHTMTDTEVDSLFTKAIGRLKEDFGAELRG